MTHSPTPRYLSIQPLASLFSVMLSRLGLYFELVLGLVLRRLKSVLVCSGLFCLLWAVVRDVLYRGMRYIGRGVLE